jgi:iron complex outermembrane receptor protein
MDKEYFKPRFVYKRDSFVNNTAIKLKRAGTVYIKGILTIGFNTKTAEFYLIMKHSFCLKRHLVLSVCLVICVCAHAQKTPVTITGVVADAAGKALESVTASLYKAGDSSLVKISATNKDGRFLFEDIEKTKHFLSFTATGYQPVSIIINPETAAFVTDTVRMLTATDVLGAVTVTSKKPLVELRADKTIINVDASVTNVGATALEVLEKSPGVTVDRNGTISLKGRQNVLVMLDGKQTYLSSTELSNMLSSMSASQIDIIEIMTNPSSKYDAAGSTGIINIKTKKIKTRGFNATLNLATGQGHYSKNNHSLMLNYRNGKLNYFLNYNLNFNQGFTDLYAFRKYYEADGKTVTSMMEQPSFFSGKGRNHSLRGGIDYFLSKKTTLGLSLTGLTSNRSGRNSSSAFWMDASGSPDSTIETRSTSSGGMDNGAVNLNLRQTFSSNEELAVDLDWLGYKLGNKQYFENERMGASGYLSAINGDLPSTIRIYSAKADYSKTIGKLKLEGGAKTSFIKTDNLADYFFREGNDAWKPDYGKTNHFLYEENINAVYVNAEKQVGKFTIQSGLRYESTSYEADQKGNALRKDSAFSRNYNSLFPTFFANYKADSINSFSISAGRRIDRPVFQKLNPFVFVINKYTYQSGNPYFLPQYTWNFELSHMFKDLLVTTISYGITKDYFSQIFYSDTNGLIVYSEGNLSRMRNVGISISSQFSLFPWWSVSFQGVINNKKIEGFVWDARKTSLTQGNFNINNQFRFNKGWAAELSGFFTSSEQELQEITDPTGQIGVGVSKQVFGNKGSIKFTIRDIFYTQAMKGNTIFQGATEYFKLQRDTRVATIGFTYRFGKALKTPARRSGGAGDEIQRVGS